MTTEEYLSNNHIVAKFINDVNNLITEHYTKNLPNLPITEIKVSVGNKYIKLIHDRSVWGFISRYDGVFKNSYIRKGDLLKAATWNTPAAHSRGNIIDGTAKYSVWGPAYLK
jgi:hypothetical protein